MTQKIDYLLKDELIFELTLRGEYVDHKTNVNSLRKLLRQCISNKIVPNVSNLINKINHGEEVENSKLKLLTIQELFQQLDSDSSPLTVARLNEKIKFLENKLKCLSQLKLSEDLNADIVKYQSSLNEIHVKLASILKNIDSAQLELLEHQLNKSLTQDEEMNDLADQIANPSVKTSSPIEPIGSNIASNLIPVFNVNNHANQDFYQHLVPQQTVNSIFNKLSNPIERYLQNFKVTNGLIINELLQFLRNLNKLKTETELKDVEILSILPGYAEGPLLSKIIQCKNTVPSVEYLHQEILNNFLPHSLLERIRQDLVFRPQANGEPLSMYINDIKCNSVILKCNISEIDLVTSIKRGINPTDRNKLVFEGNPITFKDLDKLCIISQNTEYNDYLRGLSPTNHPLNNYAQNTQPLYRNSYAQPKHNVHKPIVCYNCNKVGHTARQCFRKPKN